jgi:uncharacterized repeat protein (TIGR03803 family)
MDSAGYLYGTTRLGTVGGIGYGTVFKLSASGSGYTILYSFTGGSDGAQPVARLIMDGAGNLYGTTSLGGSSSNCYNGCGTVFKLSTAGGDHTILHSFTGGSDGANPTAGLIMDSAGNLYGTATNGGGPDFGNVFEILLP